MKTLMFGNKNVECVSLGRSGGITTCGRRLRDTIRRMHRHRVLGPVQQGMETAMDDWDLFDALEMHGEGHGTEEQLNVTTDLLMEAVDIMPGYALAKFMEYARERLEEVK